MCHLHLFLEMSDLVMVRHAFVTYYFDYYNMLCMRLPFKMVLKLQLVQNVATRLRPVIRSIQYKALVQQLHWLPFCFQPQFEVVVITL